MPEENSALLDSTESSSYFENERTDVLAIVPADATSILELGCASGKLGEKLKRRQSCSVIGVESTTDAARAAMARLDRVIVGDCECLNFGVEFEPYQFDCLIAADVLEHLRDPEALLGRLRPFLKAGACVVVSLPNIRHAGILEAAVNGYWSYQDWGILDRTHLRFFTRREIDHMFARLGLEVEERRTNDDPGLAEWERLGRPIAPSFGTMSVHGLSEDELRELFVFQWLVRGRYRDAERPVMTAADGVASSYAVTPPIAIEIRPDTFREFDEFRQLAAQRAEEYAALATAHAELSAEKAAVDLELQQTRDELALMKGSLSWRMTQPIRGAALHQPALATSGRLALTTGQNVGSGFKRAARPTRELGRALRAATIRSFSRGRAGPTDATECAPAYVPQLIPLAAECPPGVATSRRHRLICVTHVAPYPPRAGNEYRIYRMLRWLSRQGWSVTLVVCPLPGEPLAHEQIVRLAECYPNLVVYQRDGIVWHRLTEASDVMERLRGQRPRSFAAVLGELAGVGVHADAVVIERTFCPDALVDLLLHLDRELQSDVVLAEYVFMTRAFPLLRPSVLKIVDTHDVFSRKQENVQSFGIGDALALHAEVESQMLNRADMVIAIQPDEALALRRLVSTSRKVLTVGVDFDVVSNMRPQSAAPIVLVVASANQMNVAGLQDFLRFAWPLVLSELPTAELHVVGAVGQSVDPIHPNVQICGTVADLDSVYADSHVVINPCVAGTGLKIKTVEALCQLRPIVIWPAGADGLSTQVRDLCYVAHDWFDFAQGVISRLRVPETYEALAHRRDVIREQFASDVVYQPLTEILVADTAVAAKGVRAG